MPSNLLFLSFELEGFLISLCRVCHCKKKKFKNNITLL